MMSDLHWTGAAVLLALAVLDGQSTGQRRRKIADWAELPDEVTSSAGPRLPTDDPLRLATVRACRDRPLVAPTRRAS
ncbi:MAG TPA: hypothetical protein VII06_27270 [Chloroflexota bacterium]|jgi:hypothetical protein